MRSLARTSLGLLGLALIAPTGVNAQYAPSSAPAGYQPAAPVAAPASTGLDGKPMPAPVADAPHKHRGRTLCAKCAAKQAAALPPGKIVGCEHSRNGVCTACAAVLNMPGQFVMAPSQPTEAPGRAVASGDSKAAMNVARAVHPGPAGAFDNGMNEPAPVGLVQANFSQEAPMGAPASYAPQASQPGRAVAESMAGHDPYQVKDKSGGFPHPHILGHLFGWSGIGAERADEKARRKAEAHAMVTYDSSGTAPVDELPASMVFGKKGR